MVDDGNEILNDGVVRLNLQTIEDSPNDIGFTFQVAKVSRPLMSVGKICDNGTKVVFSSDKIQVMKGGAIVCTFERIYQDLLRLLVGRNMAGDAGLAITYKPDLPTTSL